MSGLLVEFEATNLVEGSIQKQKRKAIILEINRNGIFAKGGSGRKQLATGLRQLPAFTDATGIPRRHFTVDVDTVQLM
jgi:hypothetical protein